VGGKLHTGRSRNDQVATDMRLWLINEVRDIEAVLKSLLSVMAERADNEKSHLLPGYTHLQVSVTNLLLELERYEAKLVACTPCAVV